MRPNLPTRILIIEDDQDDFLIIEACIKDIPEKAFQIDWCYDYDDAMRRIAQAAYDIYFVDYLLGEKTGLELLQEAKALGCEDPLVLLTGIGNRDVDIQAMTIGAVDFLVKSEINTENWSAVSAMRWKGAPISRRCASMSASSGVCSSGPRTASF